MGPTPKARQKKKKPKKPLLVVPGKIGLAAEGWFVTHVDPFQYWYFVWSSI